MTKPQVVRRPRQPEQLAGHGSLALALLQHGGSQPGLIIDYAVLDPVNRLLSLGPVPRVIIDSPVEWSDINRLTELFRSRGVDSIIVVGGGNAIDAAKLVSVCLGEPLAFEELHSRAQVGGFIALSPHLWAPLPIISTPSTLGTGAEVSSVACCELREDNGDTFKCLISLPHSPVVTAAYEPSILAAPMPLLCSGAAESWTRVLGSVVSNVSDFEAANREAYDLVARAASITEQVLSTKDSSTSDLVDWALTSADSHLGWALRGRGIAPFPLWFVANEFSTVLGISKMEAHSILIPGWLAAVINGHTVWGDRHRLQQMFNLSAVADIADFERKLWSLVPIRVSPSWLEGADTLDTLIASRVIRRFGNGRPLPRNFTEESVATVVRLARDRVLVGVN